MAAASVRGVRTILAAAAALAVAACAGEAREACAWPALADTSGWIVEDPGPFVFRVPSALARQAASGGSGYLGLWAADNRALAFDYGPAAPDPRGRATGGEEGWRCEAVVGGRPAVVRVGVRTVEVRPGVWQRHAVAETWWRDAGPDSARLLVMGWGAEADSARVAREALTAARTVRFRTVWTAADSLRQMHRFCATLRAQAEGDARFAAAWEEWRARCPAGAPPPPASYDSVR